jgi:tol-pal system protein YbgF
LAPGGTRDEFNADLDLYKQGQYDNAANGLKGFVEKYPRDRMVPDAVYLLGESYSKLGRHREAAEQYLRLSTDFSKAPRAPDALLRLGMSLNAMGVKEQACATYQEVTRRYPTASADVRASVDREMKRARC